jgi:1-acyl-sn-glycerol-3-phosphate acyltransferase
MAMRAMSGGDSDVAMVKETDVSDGFFARFVRAGLRGWYEAVGWRIEGIDALPAKAVIIAVPHTSNWDFPFTLAIAAHYRLKMNFMAKDSLFRWPIGGLMRWLGGIAVDRSKRTDAVGAMVSEFARRDEMHLVIAVEGTRDAVDKWKSGFYHIAVGAGVPIALGYVDYPNKRGGFGELFYPTGNYEADMEQMRFFYRDKVGKHPNRSR